MENMTRLGRASGRHGIEVIVIVSGCIARELGAFEFEMVFSNNDRLDHIATYLIDRMSNVGIKPVRAGLLIFQVMVAA